MIWELKNIISELYTTFERKVIFDLDYFLYYGKIFES